MSTDTITGTLVTTPPIENTDSALDTFITTRDGVKLSVQDHGSQTAEHTLVLAHGLCLDKNSWNPQVSALTKQWGNDLRIIRYDHRGHGASGHAPMDTYRIKYLVEDLADVMTEMNVSGHVTLAGNSMGGMTALKYMGLPDVLRPVTPESLVLVATAAGRLVDHGIGVLLASPAVSTLYQFAKRLPEHAVDAVLHAITGPLLHVLTAPLGYGCLHESADAMLTEGSINDTPLRTKAGFLLALKQYNCYSTLASITADTTIFSGGHDLLTPKCHAEELVELIPGARHHHHPGVGHMIHHEAPELITDAINRSIHRSFAAA
jgi:pimeloyl-ACP methyl ester carboxylesterase